MCTFCYVLAGNESQVPAMIGHQNEEQTTVGTTESNAFEEDVRRLRPAVSDCSADLVELGSRPFYKVAVVHKFHYPHK